MRLTRPIGHTRFGLALFGLSGTAGLAAWGAAMFAFPSALRPVMPVLVGAIAARLGRDSPYRAEYYDVWAWAFVVFALIWATPFLVMFIRQPAEDRRIDAALRSRLEHAVRGAPTNLFRELLTPPAPAVRSAAQRQPLSVIPAIKECFGKHDRFGRLDRVRETDYPGTVRRKLVIGASLAAAVIGLSISVDAQNREYKPLSEPDRQACIADGGHVAVLGMSGTEGCVRPMPDAGKACTDGSQCKGRTCVLDESRPDFEPPAPNSQVTGQCAATDFGFGCAWRVSDGEATGMCVD